MHPEEGLDGDGLLNHLIAQIILSSLHMHRVIHSLQLLGWYVFVQGHAPPPSTLYSSLISLVMASLLDRLATTSPWMGVWGSSLCEVRLG